jgi:ketosteroid isomerase-like protein
MSLTELSSPTLASSRKSGAFASYTQVRVSSAEEFWHRYATAFMARDFERWGDLWAEDGRYVIAFPLPGTPAALEGRATIVDAMRTMLDRTGPMRFVDASVHETREAGVFFVEYRLQVDAVGGATFENRVCARVTVHEGEITELLEYYDPGAYQRFVRGLNLA